MAAGYAAVYFPSFHLAFESTSRYKQTSKHLKQTLRSSHEGLQAQIWSR